MCNIDLRIGGKYRYVLKGPHGEEMGFGGVHKEIVAPERIVARQLYDMDWTGGETITTLQLTEKDGRTTIATTILFAS